MEKLIEMANRVYSVNEQMTQRATFVKMGDFADMGNEKYPRIEKIEELDQLIDTDIWRDMEIQLCSF